jgi:hypothetical protein
MNKSRLNIKILEYLEDIKEKPQRIIARSVYSVTSGDCLNTTVRVDTYRSLKSLTDSGFIERSSNTPATYRITGSGIARIRPNYALTRNGLVYPPQSKAVKSYKGRGHHNKGKIGSRNIYIWRKHR